MKYVGNGGIDRVLHFGMRHVKYVLTVLGLLCISAAYVFTVQADVALFFSDTYVEQGVEIPDESGTTTRIQYEHTWTDFKGVVPDGAEVNSIFLHLTWSKVERASEEDIRIQSEAEVVPSETSTSSFDTEAQTNTPNTNSQSAGGGNADSVIANPVLEATPSEPVVSETVEETVGEVVPEHEQIEIPSTIIETTPVPVNEPETPKEEKGEEPSSPPLEESASPSDTTGFEAVSLMKLFPLALAEFEESTDDGTAVNGENITVSMSAQETDSDAVLTIEPAPTSTNLASSEIVTTVPETHFFDILYSLDGTTWQLLKQVSFDEEQDMFIDLTSIGYGALKNLRISIRYSIPSEYHEKIVIDSLRLELGYGEPRIEAVGGEIGYDDRMPNFEMSAIKNDIESENIRAVVLERGGILEFWYSVTDAKTKEVVWNKILGGGPIDGTAPIAITKRTIFWLDRNQQTLYGFGVDEESIFGVSFEDPEHKVFLLPFEDEEGKKWEASFNAEQNALEFDKVKSKS